MQAEDTPVLYDEDRQQLIQRATDWHFLQYLARRNGARLYFEYDGAQQQLVAHFGPPDLTATPQPDVALLQDGASLNWADLQLVATGPTKWTAAALDPIGKRIVRGDGDARARTVRRRRRRRGDHRRPHRRRRAGVGGAAPRPVPARRRDRRRSDRRHRRRAAA